MSPPRRPSSNPGLPRPRAGVEAVAGRRPWPPRAPPPRPAGPGEPPGSRPRARRPPTKPPPANPSPWLNDRTSSATKQHRYAEATGAPPPRSLYIDAGPPGARRLFQKPPEPSGRTLPNRRRGRAPAPAPWPRPRLSPGRARARPERSTPNGRRARPRARPRAPAQTGILAKVWRLPGPLPPTPGLRCQLGARARAHGRHPGPGLGIRSRCFCEVRGSNLPALRRCPQAVWAAGPRARSRALAAGSGAGGRRGPARVYTPGAVVRSPGLWLKVQGCDATCLRPGRRLRVQGPGSGATGARQSLAVRGPSLLTAWLRGAEARGPDRCEGRPGPLRGEAEPTPPFRPEARGRPATWGSVWTRSPWSLVGGQEPGTAQVTGASLAAPTALDSPDAGFGGRAQGKMRRRTLRPGFPKPVLHPLRLSLSLFFFKFEESNLAILHLHRTPSARHKRPP